MKNAILRYDGNGLLRIGKIFPLLNAQFPDTDLVDTLEELRDFPDKKLKAMCGWVWEEGMDASEVLENLSYGREGYLLAHVSTPIIEEHTNAISWGWTTYSWVVGKDIAEVIDLGLAWVDEQKPRKKVKYNER